MTNGEAQGTRFTICVAGGELDGACVEVTAEGLIVGRANTCGLVIKDNRISRQHARFFLQDGFCYVEDLGSRNGLLVGGRRTRRQCLRQGDVIDLGCCRLALATEGSPLERQTPEPIVEQVKFLSTYAPGLEAAASAVERRHNPFAVAALPFALLAAFHWAFGIGAVGLAALGLWEIARRDMHKGTALAVAALVLGVLLGTGNVVYRAAFLSRRAALGHADRACEANLERIGRALDRYADEHDGRYPDELAELCPAYLPDAQRLSCPACVSRGGQWCEYWYPGAGRLRAAMQDDVIACDRTAAHHGGVSAYALMGDGRVVRKPGGQLEMIAIQTEAR